MKVTVKYGNGGYSHVETIAANDARVVMTVNNAAAGEHTISFTTSRGAGSGTVRVRVSDTAL